MSLQDTALPEAGTPAEAGGQSSAPPEEQVTSTTEEQGGEPRPETEQPKKEKTPEEREIARLRRRVDSLTKRYYQAAQSQEVANTHPQSREQTAGQQADDEPVQLSRAELQRLIDQEAKKLAPTITQANAEIERRKATVEKLATTWGQEKFDAYAAELDDAFGGLTDAHGRAKPATDAIFESDMPHSLIEYLADPDNAAEAEAIGRMSAVQAGRAIGKLEDKLTAKQAEAKPQRSQAPAPLESDRGRGTADPDPSRMTDAQFAEWRRKQIAARR